MSIGEDRVRTKFNPSANGIVDQIKQKSAELIDLLAAIPQPNGERARLVELAATAYEEGAMWAVKAATAPLPESLGTIVWTDGALHQAPAPIDNQ